MRPSQRDAILDAALRLLAVEAGATITLEAVAVEAGVTKAGLMYHFPTREQLMLGIVDQAARRVEAAMLDQLNQLDVAFDRASPAQRVAAYAQVAADGAASRGEYAVWTEAGYRPDLAGPWIERMSPWLVLPEDLDSDLRARLTLARLAADGLWAALATGLFPPERDLADAVTGHLRILTDDHPAGGTATDPAGLTPESSTR